MIWMERNAKNIHNFKLFFHIFIMTIFNILMVFRKYFWSSSWLLLVTDNRWKFMRKNHSSVFVVSNQRYKSNAYRWVVGVSHKIRIVHVIEQHFYTNEHTFKPLIDTSAFTHRIRFLVWLSHENRARSRLYKPVCISYKIIHCWKFILDKPFHRNEGPFVRYPHHFGK